MHPDVSVIIVNYNGRELLEDCIASVCERADDGLTVEMILVDNASTDGSAAYVAEHHPDVRLIRSPDNGGFASGNNLGMAAASAPALLLLNSDARLEADALPAMLAVLESESDIGQVGPRLRGADGGLQRSARAYPTLWRLATEFLYLRKLGPRTRALNHFYMGWFGYDRRLDVDFLMGACLLVRAEAARAVGPMNERYFMFSEETDWARRFVDGGWRVTFDPAAEVLHLGGQSTRKSWERMYASQVCGSVRFIARTAGTRAARRARRLLVSALSLRGTAYRLAGLIPVRGGADRRARARVFQGARLALLRLDVRELAAGGPPTWAEVEARLRAALDPAAH